jgi:superfamily II DNA/RNA helicase
MATPQKSIQQILQKLRIKKLNPMQETAQEAIQTSNEVVLLSPTGTGKTLAFLLPVVTQLDPANKEVQVLILVPSRELAIQIEQVTREMGTGFKTNAVYGGRPIAKDKIDLQRPPAILIGTPGRVADHMRRGTFSTEHIRTLVLDEFDKSLEIGFEVEMREIIVSLRGLEKKILTSATDEVEIPDFIRLKDARKLNFAADGPPKLQLRRILSPEKDKLETLFQALCHIGNQPGIVFCNFKDSIRRVSEYLTKQGIDHGCYYGGLEQQDRERALIKFRNGTNQLLIATDLASRGLDIPEIAFIIHYHLPIHEHEFIHRNGRTARMQKDGTAYVLQWVGEELPFFIDAPQVEKLQEAPAPDHSGWRTVFVSGGRRDKISKGDIAGLFFKQGGLSKDQLGNIELKQDCAFVGVAESEVGRVIGTLDNRRLKKKKVRLRVV